MSGEGLLSRLRAATGDLRPGQAGAGKLHELRRELAALLNRNPAPEAPAGAATDELLESQLRLAASEAAAPRFAAAPSRFAIVRRDAPLLLAGQAPAEVFGPFRDAVGRDVWFDKFVFPQVVQIAWGNQPAALVIPATAIVPGTQRFEMAAGTVWVAARLLAAGAPANAYAGWKVERATLELSAAGIVNQDKLTLPANATARLILVPDDSEAAAPAPGPGADAAQATLRRPAQADFVITASAVAGLRAEPAEVNLLGLQTSLTRSESTPVYDKTLERIFIPFTPDRVRGELSTVSPLCRLARAAGAPANLTAAGWCPIMSSAQPGQLGDAGSGGMFTLILEEEITATGSGLADGPLRAARMYLIADRGMAGLLAPAAQARTASYRISLPDGGLLQLTTDEPFAYLFLSSRSANDVVQYRGTLEASLAAPVLANGSRLPLSFSKATLTLAESAAGTSAFGSVGDQQFRGRQALALSNGLFTVTQAMQIDWQAKLIAPDAASSAGVQLLLGIYQLLPMLPDPYAANFGPDRQADAPRGRLRINISWSGGAPVIQTTVVTAARGDGSPEIAPAPLFSPISDPAAETLRDQFHDFVHARPFLVFDPQALRDLRLLDVSTNADQFGVDIGYAPGEPVEVRVEGSDLVSLGGKADVLMLPQMQWEPVHIVDNKDAGKLPDRIAHPDDGGPTLVGARTVRLTPVAPGPLAASVVAAFSDAGERTAAFFTLPFGIRALATLDPERTLVEKLGSIELFRKSFIEGFTSAAQIRLKAAPALFRMPVGAGVPVLVREPPFLAGAAVQTVHATNPFNPAESMVFEPPPPPAPQVKKTVPPPFSALTPLDQDFNLTFGPGRPGACVPIERVDLSGYGASCFSDWWHDQPIGIANVRFEVLSGRTRYEVIRMKTILGPCAAVVVRTITLERTGSGNVYRWDSGWQPVTHGLFEWPDATVKQHTGAVRGFYNIRHIRDTPGTYAVDGGKAEVQLVYFDTDVELDYPANGASAGRRTPSLGQVGFVQRIPRGLVPAAPLNRKQFEEVLRTLGPFGGPFDCVLDIGGSGQQMRVTSAFSAPAPGPGGTEFPVACYGSLSVPRNEQWSTVRITTGSGTVAAVDPGRGVPLIRKGGTPHNPASGNYRLADPESLLDPNPATDYGLLLTTDTNRLLFRRPEIPEHGTQILGALKPVLADPYSLAGVGGLFPPIGRCLHLDLATYALDLAGGAFRWAAAGTVGFTIPDLGNSLKRFLSKTNAFDLFADYAGTQVEIAANQLKPWGINIPQVPSGLDLKTPFKADGILSVVNDLATATTDGLPLPRGPEVRFGGILDEAAKIITAFNTFFPDTPPIEVHLSAPNLENPSLELTIAARFPIAKPDGSAVDLGIGKFRGQIEAGTEIRLALTGFGGRIYFAVGGELQQPLLPKIAYVGGSLHAEISINETGTPAVRLVTSAVASVGGDLIPLLVEVEGSVSYGVFLDTARDPFIPGVALGMEVRAKLLSGFVGVRFRADVAVGIIPTNPGVIGGELIRDILIQGQFRASGSVIAAWGLVEEDFEKTLAFEQTIPGLVAGAVMVATGTFPVPV